MKFLQKIKYNNKYNKMIPILDEQFFFLKSCFKEIGLAERSEYFLSLFKPKI